MRVALNEFSIKALNTEQATITRGSPPPNRSSPAEYALNDFVRSLYFPQNWGLQLPPETA